MTTPDPTALVAAAQQRSHDTRRRAVDALGPWAMRTLPAKRALTASTPLS